MPLVLNWTYCLSALFGLILMYTNRVHMFQLNAYKYIFHKDWMRKNIVSLSIKALLPILSAVLFCLPFAATKILAVLCNITFGLLYLPKKAKKPLVFTARVKRLYATAGVLFAISLIAVRYEIPVWQVPLVLGSYFMLLCNLINRPVEQAVRRYYINQAKKKIADLPNLTVIGITGSYGKTGTKYILERLLSQKYNVLMTPASYNTTMGVVKVIRENLTAAHDIFICEMGARNVGEIKEICDIVRPRYGIITSIGPCHLETFGSIENVIRTKFELCDALPNDGVLFLNNDNEYLAKKTDIPRKVVRYGLHRDGADYFADVLSLGEHGTSFCVQSPDGERFELQTKLLGAHNIVNVLGCVALARMLDVDVPSLLLGASRIEGAPHRLSLLRGDGYVIIDDAFNSNPAGAKAALEVLSRFEGEKILITPGMIELGEEENDCNREFGRRAASVCDRIFLIGEKQTEYIRKGIEESDFPPESVRVFSDVTQAIRTAQTTGVGRRVILLENDLPDNF